MKKNLLILILLTFVVNIFSQGVGIGTKSPTHKLHVSGQVRIDTLLSGSANDSIVTASPSTGVLGRTSLSKVLGSSTTNTFSVTNGAITNTTNGVAATLTPLAGTLSNKFLGFDASGNLVTDTALTSISNTLTSSSNAFTTTINGVSSTLTPSPGTLSNKYLGFDASGNLVTDTAATGNLYTADGTLTGNRTVTQGTNTITFSGSAANLFSVDDSTISVNATNNRLGIQTKSPGEALDVRGNFQIGTGDAEHYIAFRGLTGDGAGAYDHSYIGNRLYNGSDNSELFIYQGNDFSTNIDRIRLGSGEIRFQTINGSVLSGAFGAVASSGTLADRMIIANSGNVRIGNTAPTDKLHVSGTARIETMNTASASDNIVYADATGVLKKGSQTGKVLNYVVDVTALSNSSFSSTTATDLISYIYNPVSTNSKILVEYQNQNYTMSGGVGAIYLDDYQSLLVFNGATAVTNYWAPTTQINDAGKSFRSSTLLPIRGVYLNSSLSALTIKVQIKKVTSDDVISFAGSSNGTLTITEIGN